MGTLYFGPYHEEIDAYSHEGYTVRVMPNGTETSCFGGEYGFTGHAGYRARCECGWSGSTVYPVPDPDPMESAEADEEWFQDHITPLVEKARRSAWPDWQRRTTERAATVVEHISANRHRYAIEVMTRLREDLDARLRTLAELADTAAGGERR